MRHTALLLLTSLSLSFSAYAGNGDHQQHSQMAKEMHASMQKMHHDMSSMKMTGDAEVDFMKMMIPHHQGAIDMSKIYLKYSSNPDIRSRAEKIINEQTKEIEEMEKLIEAERSHSGKAK